MGRYQKAESMGLIASVICAALSIVAMNLYLHLAPAIWLVSGRMTAISSGVVASCSVGTFIVGYSRQSHSWNLNRGWLVPLRRGFEVLALSVVYAATVFLSMFALMSISMSIVGKDLFQIYLVPVIASFSGVVGYITFVQAEMLTAKTIATMLPLFIMAGVATAGFTTDDPYWWHNNFSQLGDSTTFAARMFNSTIILAGICVIILSYFAISELITTYRMRRRWQSESAQAPGAATVILHFWPRILCMASLLALSGLFLSGIGIFRYSMHPIIHNTCARSIAVTMGLLLIALPWLAPQLSKAMFVVSDLIVLVIAVVCVHWLSGHNTMTNVEALACALFLGWFIVFARQIAALESDRIYVQMTAANPASAAQESRLSPQS